MHDLKLKNQREVAIYLMLVIVVLVALLMVTTFVSENIIEAKNIEDVTKYKSDLQIIFGMLEYRKDKRRLLEYTKEHSECLKNLDYESLQAMAVLLNTGKLLAKVKEKKGADGNMCQALEEYYQDGVQEGIEKGIEQGKKSIIANMLKKGLNIEMIVELSGLSKNEVLQLSTM